MIKLGQTVKDKITGFKGIVTGRVEYITGCDQLLIQPKSKDGEMPKSEWLDINRVEVDKEGEIIEIDSSVDKGACQQAPIK